MGIFFIFHDTHLIEDSRVEITKSSQRSSDALAILAWACLYFSIERADELFHPFSFDLGLGDGVGDRVVPVEFQV